SARGHQQRAGSGRRLHGPGNGLCAQEQSRRCRSRLGAGRLRTRRQQDRARACRTGQVALSDWIARLGSRRRYCCLQQKPQAKSASPNSVTKRTINMAWSLRTALAILVIILFVPLAVAQDHTPPGSVTTATPDGSEVFSPAQAHEIENIVKN